MENVASAVVQGKLYVVANSGRLGASIYGLNCNDESAEFKLLAIFGNHAGPFKESGKGGSNPLAAEWNDQLFFCIKKTCGKIDFEQPNSLNATDSTIVPMQMADLNDDHSGGKMKVVNGKLMVFGGDDVASPHNSAKAEYYNALQGRWEKVEMPFDFPVSYEGFTIAEGSADNVHFFSGFGYDESNFMRMMNLDLDITIPEPVVKYVEDMYQYSVGDGTLTTSNSAPNTLSDNVYTNINMEISSWERSFAKNLFASIGGKDWIVHHRTYNCATNQTEKTAEIRLLQL